MVDHGLPPPVSRWRATWDTDLAQREGEAFGSRRRGRAATIFLLGPGLNIQRVPQCGRNFEYFGEDPLPGRSHRRGVRPRWSNPRAWAATAKHFAANNHENDRNNDSSEVDERNTQ